MVALLCKLLYPVYRLQLLLDLKEKVTKSSSLADGGQARMIIQHIRAHALIQRL
jgi:hypothetical protein